MLQTYFDSSLLWYKILLILLFLVIIIITIILLSFWSFHGRVSLFSYYKFNFVCMFWRQHTKLTWQALKYLYRRKNKNNSGTYHAPTYKSFQQQFNYGRMKGMNAKWQPGLQEKEKKRTESFSDFIRHSNITLSRFFTFVQKVDALRCYTYTHVSFRYFPNFALIIIIILLLLLLCERSIRREKMTPAILLS